MIDKNLKLIRNELDISAQKLANKLGVSLTSIQQYEAGTRKPNYEFLEKIHSILNINLNWLVSGKGEMFINEQSKTNRTEIDEEQIKALFDKFMQERGFI